MSTYTKSVVWAWSGKNRNIHSSTHTYIVHVLPSLKYVEVYFASCCCVLVPLNKRSTSFCVGAHNAAPRVSLSFCTCGGLLKNLYSNAYFFLVFFPSCETHLFIVETPDDNIGWFNIGCLFVVLFSVTLIGLFWSLALHISVRYIEIY